MVSHVKMPIQSPRPKIHLPPHRIDYVLKPYPIAGHGCALPEEDHVLSNYISDGLFVELRRKFRKYHMLNETSAESKSILKSSSEMAKEKIRHLRKYYYMIHPFSKCRQLWENVMIFVYFGLFVLIPVEMLSIKNPFPLLVFKLLLDVISYVDIILFFCTGYYDANLQKVVLQPSEVAKHYILGYFLIDLISCQSVNMWLRLTQHRNLFCFQFILVLKLFRVPTFLKYLRKYFERNGFFRYNLKAVASLICFFLTVLWATGLIFLLHTCVLFKDAGYGVVEEFYATLNINSVMKHTFKVIRQLMMVGLGNIDFENSKGGDLKWHESILPTIFTLVGCIFNMIIFAIIMQIYDRYANSANKYNQLVLQISEYMRYKELPPTLRERIIKYLDFKFQKRIFKETDILNTLSRVLKADIVLHNCKDMVEKVEFFRDLPTDILLRIVIKLRSEIYLTNDVIIQAGIAGNSMYFIYMGAVAVYTNNGREICHLEEGSHFGEIALVSHEPRVATVVAIKECEVFRLSRRDFQEAFEPYPDLSNKIRELAMSRLKSTMKMMDAPTLRLGERRFAAEDKAGSSS